MSARYLSAFILGLASLKMATGLAVQYPELIPGPGLPSLEELGLTSAQLYKMPRPQSSSQSSDGLVAREHQDAQCGPDIRAYAGVKDAIACYHYLYSIGSHTCEIKESDNNFKTFCFTEFSKVSAALQYENHAIQLCFDVADALLYIIDHCTLPDQRVAGFEPTLPNPHIIVEFNDASW